MFSPRPMLLNGRATVYLVSVHKRQAAEFIYGIAIFVSARPGGFG